MPTKTSKSKNSGKNDKPKRKINVAQAAFVVFAVLLIIVMLLSTVSKF